MKPRRRWFRFSLRTFFVLVTVFGVWLSMQVNWIRQRHEALQLADKNGGYYWESSPFRDDDLRGTFNPAPWSIRLLGEPGILYVAIGPAKTSRYTKREMQALFPEAEIEHH